MKLMIRFDLAGVAGAALIVAFFGNAGCVSLKCPEGTIRVGDYCKRVDPDVIVSKDVVIVTDTIDPDAAVDVLDSGGNPDLMDAGDEGGDVAGDISDVDAVEPEDVGNPDLYPGGYIGMACNTPAVCRGEGWPDGKCLSWPRGFCAMPGCDIDLVCPEGTECMNLAAGSTGAFCTVACDDVSDCRDVRDALGNGYACKKVPDPDGVFKSICYMEGGEAREVGGPCQTHEDCLGPMGCLPNFDGGYCAVLTCDAENPCPEGSLCTRLQGAGVCLKACQESSECEVSLECVDGEEGCVDGQRALSRACIQMKNAINLDPIKVCGSGTVGKGIGEQCLNETECKTGKCNVSYTGTCSDFDLTGRRCRSDADCAISSAICRQSSEETYGFCTASCGTTACTTDQSVCVMTLDDSNEMVGLCLPACQPSNPDDPFSESDCWEEAGLRCFWGDTKFQPNVRSCVRIDPGDPGMSCRQDDECYSGNCIGETGQSDGFCTMPCLDGDLCPFPTVCQTVGDVRLCMKRCASIPDCPGSMTCQTSIVGDYCKPVE